MSRQVGPLLGAEDMKTSQAIEELDGAGSLFRDLVDGCQTSSPVMTAVL